MAFTYDPALTNPLDRIRQRLGDTVVAGHLLEDETITAQLTASANDEDAATYALAMSLMQSESRKSTTRTFAEGDTVTYQNRLVGLKALIASFENSTLATPKPRRRRRTLTPFRPDC